MRHKKKKNTLGFWDTKIYLMQVRKQHLVIIINNNNNNNSNNNNNNRNVNLP